MKKIVLPLLLFSILFSGKAQEMNNKKLGVIINQVADTVQGDEGRWQFLIKETMLICVTDENHNRMRIISPIVEASKLTEELMLNSLVANFHTALDVKYAVSDEIVWSVFIHPLRELSSEQVEDAISQVYYANNTFGVSFSSTNLIFPGNTKKEERSSPEENKSKI
ncbi:hypothetical protein ACFQ1M_04875 [Sungkyunkwania multivorans]|uniref:YbjN domain-containing protein n=1 Tax=Sungkyunkwania multivorans TaxID=1173618 RepID=A0ABW3CXD2_9FLAO